MLKRNLALLAGSVALFASSVAIAAVDFDSPPPTDEDRQYTRKSGDMIIFYNGRSYRSLSGRRGSLHTRGYRGGGLHGGK